MSVRPLSAFWKTPKDLREKMNSKGGVRAKKYYMSALKQAYGGNLRRCQYCDDAKIDVLTECSHFACLDCFHDGIICEHEHCDGYQYLVHVGWNANQQAHQEFTSKYYAKEQRRATRNSPSKRTASPSAEQRGRNKQPRQEINVTTTTTTTATAAPANTFPVPDNSIVSAVTTSPTTATNPGNVIPPNIPAPGASLPIVDDNNVNLAILHEFRSASPTAEITNQLQDVEIKDNPFLSS